MSGLMEILIIFAIILGILFIPRMLRKQPEPETRTQSRSFKLNGWERMAILASFLWLAFFVLYLKPWNTGWHVFIYVGPGPVVLAWGLYWVFKGFKKKGR